MNVKLEGKTRGNSQEYFDSFSLYNVKTTQNKIMRLFL